MTVMPTASDSVNASSSPAKPCTSPPLESTSVPAAMSAFAPARRAAPGTPRRRAGANALIAAGTLVLSSGGLVQGLAGDDEAFTLSLAVGITVIYSGFWLSASGPGRRRADDAGWAQPEDPDGGGTDGSDRAPSSRRNSLPSRLRGSSSTSSKVVGTL